MKRILSYVLSTILCLSAISFVANATDITSEFDYGPIIYVEDESLIPQAVLNNIAICKAKNSSALTIEKEELFNAYLTQKNIDTMNITPRIVVTHLVDIVQNPQDTNYYCGYAALQSMLEFHDIYKTQSQIASEAYSQTNSLAWFIGSEAQSSDWTAYPAAAYLSAYLNHSFRPFNSYFGTFTESTLLEKIKYNVDIMEEGILVCGVSKGNNSNGSKLPNYPSSDITHWIIIDGYYLDTDTQEVTAISFVDPAKSDEVSWSDPISAYSETTLTTMFKFAQGRGIIW